MYLSRFIFALSSAMCWVVLFVDVFRGVRPDVYFVISAFCFIILAMLCDIRSKLDD